MKLHIKEILDKIPIQELKGDVSVEVNQIHFDSRKVTNGSLFLACRGTVSDGHDFIEMAIKRGAIVIVCEEFPEKIHDSVTYIKVENAQAALGHISHLFFGEASKHLKLVGVTGTNGKTTIATLLYQLFKDIGYKVGLLSTVCNYIDDEVIPSTHTTPDAIQLNQLLCEMMKQGCEYCFMEVSSHAIDQKRIEGLQFTGGIFTNITHDHLDYHKTFDKYLKAKKGFFDTLPKGAFAVSNADDRNGKIMLQNTKAHKLMYSVKSIADFRCRILERRIDGTLLDIDNIEVWTNLIGDFNASNLLAVYATACLLNQDKYDVLKGISQLQSVNGRFQSVISPEEIMAIVDYAHTPDALKNVLNTIANLRTHNEQVITVVGAGGDRDKSKRPEMAKIAAIFSDKVILTSDNPRTEDPVQIIEDMKKGVNVIDVKKVLSIADRKEAIRTAVMLAQPKDIILIAGKGHENYQEINGIKHHFDDKEVICEIFKM